ncbi:Zinc finger BED domain-containing protein RICESLEEPER 1, partial [Cucurbita argyrosperma subsp. sororia]
MEISNDSSIKKPKRLTSVVWNHFERVRKADICYAVCLHCNKKLSGSSNSGTTHLRNHLMRCLKRSNYDVSQLLAAKRMKKDSSGGLANISFDEGQRKDEFKSAIVKYDPDQRRDEVVTIASSKFDQERSRNDLARMIILHGYPLSIVEHVGFKVFVKNVQPLFEVLPNRTIELACMEIYEKEKEKIFETINRLQGRINVSVEMWSSPENMDYLCLTAHYIDEDWKLQKKLLNFITLDSSHTDDMLSDVIIKCLMDWDIDCKLFSLTFDDFSTNDEIIRRINEHISKKRPLLSNGRLFDVCSAAHTMNAIAEDVIEALREITQKIRASFKYIRSSQVIQGRFNEMAHQVGITSQKILVPDSPGQWNSTYFMLETAIEYKAAFNLLHEHDPDYASPLTVLEWEWTTNVAGYLKLFVEIMNIFSSNKTPTANIYFPEICDVHIQLIAWCKSSDNFLSSLASRIKAKFDKYWSKCSLALAVAAVLDPRFKMKLVEYYYSQIYGSTAMDRVKEVSSGIKELYDAYSIRFTSVDQGSALPGSGLPGTSNDSRDRLKGFDKFLHETSQGQNVMSDLDKYLEEPVFPRNCDFNILNWWNVHTPRYPILSRMARDVIGTPMSSIGPKMAFSTGGRVLDRCRSSLSPDTRQALICAQDWLRLELEDPRPLSSAPYIPFLLGTD